MIKEDMAKELAKKVGITQHEAHVYISALKEIIMEGLARDGKVKWVGLGVLERRKRAAKRNNPIPGYVESKIVPEYYTAIFHCGKDLKVMLNT